MKKEMIFYVFLYIIFSVGFLLAQGNETNETETCEVKPLQGECCLGDECVGMEALCIEGYKVVFRGCDEQCQPKIRCDLIQTENNSQENETEDEDNETESQKEKFEARTGQECPEECECTGVTTKCEFEGGREMTVYAGSSGNIIVQIKGVNMTTNVTLYKNKNNTLIGEFDSGEKQIKIFPDEAKEKIEEKVKHKINGEEITLKKDGNYEIKAKKKAKLFWIFSVNEKLITAVSSENGQVGKIRAPWWGFLAKDTD